MRVPDKFGIEMNDPGNYQDYVHRLEGVQGRKTLTADEYAKLTKEFGRLLARLDPNDIQLDEWKRLDELRFLLVLPEEDDEGEI